MIPRIKSITPLDNYYLRVEFDGGEEVIYDVNEDIRNISAFSELKTVPHLFGEVRLDSSRTCVYWNDRIDLPSDTILEYGMKTLVSGETISKTVL